MERNTSLAVAAGATILEKHFTDNKKYRESDNFFSLNKDELKEIRFNLIKLKYI